MSVGLAEPVAWSNRRWWWIVFLLFALQVILALFLSQPALEGPRPRVSTSIRLVDGTTLDREAAELLSLRDPTLFGLVNAHGFSGAAWLRMAPFPYQTANRPAPPEGLRPNVSRLAGDFLRFVGTNVAWPAASVGKLPPMVLPSTISSPATLIRPTLRIEGDLAGRRLLYTNALPLPEPGMILTNCVIQVLVDAKGRTFSAVPLFGSGSSKADDNALKFAKAARFTPLNGNSLESAKAAQATFGKLVFQWLGDSEPSTNAPSAKP